MGHMLQQLRSERDLRVGHLKGIVPFLFALGCARAWSTLVVAAPPMAPVVSFDTHNLFDYTLCLVALAMMGLAKVLLPLNEHRGVRIVAVAGMVLASVCHLGAFALPAYGEPLALASSLFGGVGFGMFLLLWAELLWTLPLLRILLYITASQLVAIAFVFFCSGLDALRMGTALVFLPAAAVGSLAYAYHAVPADDRPPRAVPRMSYPWKLFALIALYSFAYGLRSSQFPAGAGTHSSVSSAIVGAVLFLSAYFFWNRFNIGTAYRSSFVLIACGFLLVPVEGVLGTTVSGHFIAISYSLMSIIVTLLLYDITKRLGVTVVVFSAIKGAERVFIVWGKDASDALGTLGLGAGVENMVVSGLVVALVLAASLILLSEKELASKWGVRILDAGGLVQKTPEQQRLDERCAALAERCRLTPRETEILELVAQGKSGPAIMQELFIAEGTLKAHMSHIYEKCGVANRRELREELGC